MANQEHLSILRQGVSVWNKWRKEHPEIQPDLSGFNLTAFSNADLSDADLSNTNLSNTVLAFTDLSGANLQRASVLNTILLRANFNGADLDRACFSFSNLRSANFTNALHINRVIINGADLSEANLSNCNLSGANFSECNLSRANLSYADLTAANLSRAVLIETNMRKATLTGCSIFGVSAWNIELEGTTQGDLVITSSNEPTIMVDHLEVAQFIIFKIAGQSISGYIPGLKTGSTREIRCPYTSLPEQMLAMYLEYHIHVRFYQRGDASDAFARAHHLHTPLGTPYPISYLYQGEPHEYLPDFVGTLCDGSLLIAEAGLEEQKSKGQALAEAARRLAQLKGGVYWIATEKNLSLKRHLNLQFLHIRRETFRTYDEIATALLAYWPRGEFCCVNELVQRFGSQWSDYEVEAAVWKLVGDAAAEGRLLVDLTDVELSLTTPLALLHLELPPILPDPLPSSLEAVDAEPVPGSLAQADDPPPVIQSSPLGTTFDDSVLEPEVRARFLRNFAAVTDVLGGKGIRQAAQEHGMAPSTVSRLQQRVKVVDKQGLMW